VRKKIFKKKFFKYCFVFTECVFHLSISKTINNQSREYIKKSLNLTDFRLQNYLDNKKYNISLGRLDTSMSINTLGNHQNFIK
jgi:hypothetical protein